MTPVGRFLEKSKLDELPQLWNVLRGDMSFVGPRPESPDFADCFDQVFVRVRDFRPGIFGPSQAIFRFESSLYPKGAEPERYYRAVLFPLKARIDLAYYPDSSVVSDIGWILRCMLTVFGFHAPCPAHFLKRIRTGKPAVAPALHGVARLLVAEREQELRSAASGSTNPLISDQIGSVRSFV